MIKNKKFYDTLLIEMQKYTYEDWWDGKIYMNTSSVFIKKNSRPKSAAWNQIFEKDVHLIKCKQKELFDAETKDMYNAWTLNFKKKFDNSEMNELLLENEIKQVDEVLFGDRKPDSIGLHYLKHWGFSISSSNLFHIQQYIIDYIKNGLEKHYQFVHSPNCKFRIPNEPYPEVYAQVTWDYGKWLIDFKKQLQILSYKNNIERDFKNETNDETPNIEEEINIHLIKFKGLLNKYGFFELEMVKKLSAASIEKLVINISNKDVPYQIAMFDFLKFLDYLDKGTRAKFYKNLSIILDAKERTIRGNVNVLVPSSKDNKERYTSHRFNQEVRSFYKELQE